MNTDSMHDWFWTKVDEWETRFERREAQPLAAWIKEFEGLECEPLMLHHEAADGDVDRLASKIIYDRHSGESDKIEGLSRLARAVALHALLRNRILEIGAVKL